MQYPNCVTYVHPWVTHDTTLLHLQTVSVLQNQVGVFVINIAINETVYFMPSVYAKFICLRIKRRTIYVLVYTEVATK